jgi:hypothetical protein
MLNLDETVETNNAYIIQRDLYIRGLLYSLGVVIFIDIIRNQVAEINLLQLIPGFYLILLFISFVLLVFSSDLFNRIPFDFDNNKSLGTKTITRMEGAILLKFGLSLFLSSIILTSDKNLVTRSVGCAPFFNQCFILSSLKTTLCSLSFAKSGLYIPNLSIKRPSLGALESARTIL